jgi:hypothetical protein
MIAEADRYFRSCPLAAMMLVSNPPKPLTKGLARGGNDEHE